MIFDDKNGNAANDGEPGLAGWTVHLSKDGSEVSTITKEDGSYRFENLALGTYTLSQELPSGWTRTTPQEGSYSVELEDADVTDKDFGNELTSYSISGKMFNDLNNDGINDGEPGLAGWIIQLSREGNVLNTTATSPDGSYKFDDLAAGTYTLSATLQSGWTGTTPTDGAVTVELKDADATGKDFGANHGSWSLSGTKFNDLNGNGLKDEDDPGLEGFTIQLSQGGSVVNATATGSDGSYTFQNLASGSYTVSEVAQEGWLQTLPKEGTYAVELTDDDVTDRDFGNKGNLSITGKKYYDANNNGVQDGDEPGLPGQEVKLVQDGQEISKVTTDQDGSYTFGNLAPGTYEVDDPILVTVTTKIKVVVNIPAIGPHSISGVKFNDLNNNGVKDSGEPGVASWPIDLVLVTPGPAPDILLSRINTDVNGAYTFINLWPGTFKVSELARQGWTPTTATELTINLPGSGTNQNFGNRLVTPPGLGSIFGLKFNDINGNGAKEGSEPGLAGWTVQLKNASNLTVLRSATTASDGSYAFLNLTPGVYVVGEVTQSGWTQTKPAVGPGGQVYSFTLSAGENKMGMDFGNHNNNLPPANPTLALKPAQSEDGGHADNLDGRSNRSRR